MSSLLVPLIRSPVNSDKQPVAGEEPVVGTRDETLFENPQFQHYAETSNLQLFFDLFFVANLTSFTNAHEVNNISKLVSYIGFFSLLWFTWCQVTLYDVRFSTDSIFERICHGCHFGVMIGLAVVGPQFGTSDGDIEWATLQQLSLILMANRVVLLCQYGSTLYFSWRFRTARLPLIAVMASLGIAIILYLGLSFAFSRQTSANAFLAWYIVSVFEVAASITVAGRWHVVSFKGTHLVERMTCLTLIILGEGVIGLTKDITKIESLDFSFSPGAIGSIVSAVLLIYFIYQLYFDNVQEEHFGIIRQQIWTFLHFPFHMALVLLMEGTNQFVSWRHVIEFADSVLGAPLDALSNLTATALDLSNAWNKSATIVLSNAFLPVTQAQFESIEANLGILSPSSNSTDDEYSNATDGILVELLKIIFDGYGFEPPESSDEAAESQLEILNSYFKVFELVFGYFFVCAGLVLIFLAALSWLSRPKGGSRKHYVGMVSNIIFGLGLALLSTMALTDAADNLGESVWTLPLVVFVLAIALVLNHTPWGIISGKNNAVRVSNIDK